MKKSLKIAALGLAAFGAVAGVAAPAMAVGVTSDDTDSLGTYTDTFNISIEKDCTFDRQSTTHGIGANAISGGAWGENTFTATVKNGDTYEAFATSSFVVTCNNQDGYKVTVTATDLEMGSPKTNDETWAYNKGSLAGSGSSWTLTSSHDGANEEDGIVATKDAAVNEDGFTVTYGLKVSDTQDAGSYSATAQYDFAQLPTANPTPAPTPKRASEEKGPVVKGGDEQTNGETEGGNMNVNEGENENEDENKNLNQQVSDNSIPSQLVNQVSMVPPVTNITNNYITPGTQGGGETQQVAQGTISGGTQKNTDEKQDALGVVSSTGTNGARTIAAAVPDPEDNHSGLIVAMCAAGVAATAGAGAYLYNKGKEEE